MEFGLSSASSRPQRPSGPAANLNIIDVAPATADRCEPRHREQPFCIRARLQSCRVESAEKWASAPAGLAMLRKPCSTLSSNCTWARPMRHSVQRRRREYVVPNHQDLQNVNSKPRRKRCAPLDRFLTIDHRADQCRLSTRNSKNTPNASPKYSPSAAAPSVHACPWRCNSCW
jgi:hypothetical protein